MNSDYCIQHYGQEVRIANFDGWKSPIFNAFVYPYRFSNGSVFCEKKRTYIIFTPRRHNIATLDDPKRYRILIKNKHYKIMKAETVEENGNDIYHFGIIEEVTEDEYI